MPKDVGVAHATERCELSCGLSLADALKAVEYGGKVELGNVLGDEI